MSVGIDFGTTNSVVVVSPDEGDVAVARHEEGCSSNFRSVLFFLKGKSNFAPPVVKAGPEAMAAYLEQRSDCRLIQSVKSMAANSNFTGTLIFGRRYSVEDLIALVLKGLRASAERDLGPLGEAAIAGRPVRFAGQFTDETLALTRLSKAFGLAGFKDITFVAQPLAAAYRFARRIPLRSSASSPISAAAPATSRWSASGRRESASPWTHSAPRASASPVIGSISASSSGWSAPGLAWAPTMSA